MIHVKNNSKNLTLKRERGDGVSRKASSDLQAEKSKKNKIQKTRGSNMNTLFVRVFACCVIQRFLFDARIAALCSAVEGSRNIVVSKLPISFHAVESRRLCDSTRVNHGRSA